MGARVKYDITLSAWIDEDEGLFYRAEARRRGDDPEVSPSLVSCPGKSPIEALIALDRELQ